jgi:hypothetical protein
MRHEVGGGGSDTRGDAFALYESNTVYGVGWGGGGLWVAGIIGLQWEQQPGKEQVRHLTTRNCKCYCFVLEFKSPVFSPLV